MQAAVEYSFPRYLAAKVSVDDRALNRHVWETLRREAARFDPLRVIEIGAGIGTMAERLVAWDLAGTRTGAAPRDLTITLVEAREDNIAEARHRLAGLSDVTFDERGEAESTGRARASSITVAAIQDDVFRFAERGRDGATWDLLIAHAVLDLFDIRLALPRLLPLLAPGGLLWASITFDGVTSLEPALDPAFDAEVERLYHATMDGRITDGRRSGDSRAGRHLYHALEAAGATVLALGGADWVVHPVAGAYPADEAYFLHFIVETIRQALADHPELDAARFAAWVEQRHRQIDRAELVYIAHQVDVLAKV